MILSCQNIQIEQFFTQSNPLNNLNITSSIVPPLLQRQNSAPTGQQQPQQQQQQTQQASQQNSFNDFYKINNVNKPQNTTSGQPDLQRKYSLPVNTTPTQSIVPTTSTQNITLQQHTQQQAVQLPKSILRKQSAPAITSSHSVIQSQQQQSQIQQGSPSRARDRNTFDKVPSSQDVVQLPLLKGYFK